MVQRMEEGMNDKVVGVWDKEQLMDALVFALFVAGGTFITSIGYKYMSAWLAETNWFGGS